MTKNIWHLCSDLDQSVWLSWVRSCPVSNLNFLMMFCYHDRLGCSPISFKVLLEEHRKMSEKKGIKCLNWALWYRKSCVTRKYPVGYSKNDFESQFPLGATKWPKVEQNLIISQFHYLGKSWKMVGSDLKNRAKLTKLPLSTSSGTRVPKLTYWFVFDHRLS